MNNVIFCESDLADDLFEQVLTQQDNSVTLILGNSDKNHDMTLERFLDKGVVKQIFAQNLTASRHSSIYPLPIGLENAWHCRNGVPKDFIESRKDSNPGRIFRIMWTFNSETNPEVRSEASLFLSSNSFADSLGYLTPRSHRAALATYGFVASPPGNGLDTHRTWEAMYLGCIPIVLRSQMTEVFQGLGLPLWIVDSYGDLESYDARNLEEKYRDLSVGFQSPALWLDYWASRIIGT